MNVPGHLVACAIFTGPGPGEEFAPETIPYVVPRNDAQGCLTGWVAEVVRSENSLSPGNRDEKP